MRNRISWTSTCGADGRERAVLTERRRPSRGRRINGCDRQAVERDPPSRLADRQLEHRVHLPQGAPGDADELRVHLIEQEPPTQSHAGMRAHHGGHSLVGPSWVSQPYARRQFGDDAGAPRLAVLLDDPQVAIL